MAESSLVRESQLVGNLLNCHLLLVAQQHLGLHHDITADPLACGDTSMLLDDGSKMLGREVHQVGIEPNFATLMVVAVYGLVESGEQFFLRRRLVIADTVLAAVVLQKQEEHTEQVAQHLPTVRAVGDAHIVQQQEQAVDDGELPVAERHVLTIDIMEVVAVDVGIAVLHLLLKGYGHHDEHGMIVVG